ncbi:MAG: hypothetical protein IMF07_03975 [Proteobacteria bacterium]|nr:hypothetical protein [Pseudomonadota bacterium]
MKLNYLKIILLFLLITGACSLPPERKITLDQLKKSELAYYVIKDDMQNMLDELNKTGEVVVTAEYFGKEVLIKIYATSNEGLVVEQFQQKN